MGFVVDVAVRILEISGKHEETKVSLWLASLLSRLSKRDAAVATILG